MRAVVGWGIAGIVTCAVAVAHAQGHPRGTQAGTNEFAVRPLRSEPKIAWDLKTSYRDSAEIVVVGNVLITGNGNGKGGTFAYDARTGKKLWSKPGHMRGGPAVDGNAAYVVNDIGSNRFRLAKLALGTGKQQWAVEAQDLGHPNGGAPLVVDGRVILVNNDRSITAYDAATGKQAWTRAVADICSPVLAAADGRIYFAGALKDSPKGITVLEPATGETTSYKLPGGECSEAVAIQDATLVAIADHVVVAVDARTGAKRWEQKLTYQERGFTKTVPLAGEPTIASGIVYVQSPQMIYGFELASGRQVFDLAVGRDDARLVAAGGVLYITSDALNQEAGKGGGWVSAIDLATKQVLWRVRAKLPDKYNAEGSWRTRYMFPVDDGLYFENESRLVKLAGAAPTKR
jgi:outer membrane protein assembly factor BamB